MILIVLIPSGIVPHAYAKVVCEVMSKRLSVTSK
jgi:hypothetical protein